MHIQGAFKAEDSSGRKLARCETYSLLVNLLDDEEKREYIYFVPHLLECVEKNGYINCCRHLIENGDIEFENTYFMPKLHKIVSADLPFS